MLQTHAIGHIQPGYGEDGVYVVRSQAKRAEAEKAAKIVAFAGGVPELVDVADAIPQAAGTRRSRFVIDAAGLAILLRSGTAERVFGANATVFVHGFDEGAEAKWLLQTISAGELAGVAAIESGDPVVQVCGERWLCQQLSGIAVRSWDAGRDRVFVRTAGASSAALIFGVGADPAFARFSAAGVEYLLTACRELADLDETVTGDTLVSWFSRLFPALLFLKRSLGGHAWQGGPPRACLIIDDPLLTPRYGFLEYGQLLRVLQREAAAATIAFIPSNHGRSKREVTQMFEAARRELALCVHGCDHIGGEFALGDGEALQGRARLARVRMDRHTKRFGVPYCDVMVFPQGRFRPEALEALESCGYLAAVNTHLSASDGGQPLRLRDLADVAVTTVAGFPLFGRHYPNDAVPFALDLFLGKPALIAEHHGYFRDGYDRLAAFIRVLYALEPGLEWGNLAEICSESRLEKMTSDGLVQVRVFTHRSRIANRYPERRTFVLQRRVPDPTGVYTVTVNGRSSAPGLHGDTLTVGLSLEPGEHAVVAVVNEARPQDRSDWKPSALYRAKVRARHLAVEIRDNYIEPSPVLSRVVSEARRLTRS